MEIYSRYFIKLRKDGSDIVVNEVKKNLAPSGRCGVRLLKQLKLNDSMYLVGA